MALDNFFGFKFKKTPEEKKAITQQDSFVPPTNDDGSQIVDWGGVVASQLDFDGSLKTDFELITRYRSMAINPELDTAIDEVVNEAIVISDEDDPVKLDLSKLDFIPEKIKEIIQDEFDTVLKLLDFNKQGYEIFRRWYIDGRLYYHAVVQNGKESEGIKELRYIDPRQIRKIRELAKSIDPDTGLEIIKVTGEYYIYNQRGIIYPSGQPMSLMGQGTVQGIKISPDCIALAHSGLCDRYSSTILSHLHKAIRPLNQLKMMEDASVIYRITRAPERRIFYIDVQDMPKAKADQYMREMMQKYRTKLVYDPNTGEVRDDRKYLTMLEDYWLPRRNGQATTSIDTLPGGANLDDIGDINYFLRKLYKSLNVPLGRLDPNNQFNVGRAAEITRDEVKFSKFITRLRNRFSLLFDEILEKQLILKNIIKKDDWEQIRQNLKYQFAKDNFFAELKDLEMARERLGILSQADTYVGKYFSETWIKHNVLRQTDDEIAEITQQIKKERAQDEFTTEPSMAPTKPSPERRPGFNGLKPRYADKRGGGGNDVPGGVDTNKISTSNDDLK